MWEFKVGQARIVTSIVEAAKFVMNEWPAEDSGRLNITKHALVECFDGKMSPRVARMAFVEAVKEADIYIEAVGRPPSTGKLQIWHISKPRRRAQRRLAPAARRTLRTGINTVSMWGDRKLERTHPMPEFYSKNRECFFVISPSGY